MFVCLFQKPKGNSQKTDELNVNEGAKVIQSNSDIVSIRTQKRSEDVDRTCRMYFPIAYAIFIVVYCVGALSFMFRTEFKKH